MMSKRRMIERRKFLGQLGAATLGLGLIPNGLLSPLDRKSVV